MLTRLVWMCLLGLAVGAGCDNEATLLNNNQPGNNSTNNPENNPPENNPPENNPPENNPPENNPPENNPPENNPPINNEDDIYETEPEPEVRDFVGTIPPFTGTGPVEQFAYDMAQKACERWIECRDTQAGLAVGIGEGLSSVGECMEQMFNRNPLSTFSSAVDDGRAQFFEEDAPLCFVQIENYECENISYLLRSPRSQLQGCQNAVFGLNGDGDPCGADADCGTETFCSKILVEDCVGTCQLATPQPFLCGEPLRECGPNQVCSSTGLACIDIVAEGEACDEDGVCGPQGFCRSGLCAPKKYGFQAGQVCNFFSNICAVGLICETDPLELENGTCKPVGDVGQACFFDSDCTFDAFCEAGACKAKSLDGTCTVNGECVSGVCSTQGACIDAGAICVLPEEPMEPEGM